MDAKRVTTVADLIRTLGGQAAAARLFDTTPQNVDHWRRKGRIPAHHYVAHQKRLAECGIDAPITLWGFAEQDAAE
jgi:hypothetical protein